MIRWLRGSSRSDLQVNDLRVQPKRASSTSVFFMFLFTAPIVAPGLDGCRGHPIPIRLPGVMSESTPAVKAPRLRQDRGDSYKRSVRRVPISLIMHCGDGCGPAVLAGPLPAVAAVRGLPPLARAVGYKARVDLVRGAGLR